MVEGVTSETQVWLLRSAHTGLAVHCFKDWLLQLPRYLVPCHVSITSLIGSSCFIEVKKSLFGPAHLAFPVWEGLPVVA